MINLIDELTFRILYGIVYLTALGIRAYFNLKNSPVVEKNFSRRWIKVAKSEGTLSAVLWTFLSIFWISFALLYVVIHHDLITMFALSFPIWFRWIGVAFGAVALPVLFWIHRTIGEYWVAYLDLREQHRLITEGPYRWVRHPMYTQSIMFLIALSLISANMLMMICSIVTIILIFNRIPREERMIIERFGDQYYKYMKHTGRLLPRIGYNNEK